MIASFRIISEICSKPVFLLLTLIALPWGPGLLNRGTWRHNDLSGSVTSRTVPEGYLSSSFSTMASIALAMTTVSRRISLSLLNHSRICGSSKRSGVATDLKMMNERRLATFSIEGLQKTEGLKYIYPGATQTTLIPKRLCAFDIPLTKLTSPCFEA